MATGIRILNQPQEFIVRIDAIPINTVEDSTRARIQGIFLAHGYGVKVEPTKTTPSFFEKCWEEFKERMFWHYVCICIISLIFSTMSLVV